MKEKANDAQKMQILFHLKFGYKIQSLMSFFFILETCKDKYLLSPWH